MEVHDVLPPDPAGIHDRSITLRRPLLARKAPVNAMIRPSTPASSAVASASEAMCRFGSA
jgi:hypothetical protein